MQSSISADGSADNSSETQDLQKKEESQQHYIERDRSEKPGIELTGSSLVFFKSVEAALEGIKQEILERLFPNLTDTCKRILTYCPGMSAFEGSWRGKVGRCINIDKAKRFVGKDFFNEVVCLFDEDLKEQDLTISQTEQVLGTFFISSVMKLYREIMLYSLFHTKLRALAEKLRDKPLNLNPAEINSWETYLSEIFKPDIATAEMVVEVQKQFEFIFQDLVSEDSRKEEDARKFVWLVTLFFLKPFPFEVIATARFIQFETESEVYRIAPFVEQLQQRVSLSKRGIISRPKENSAALNRSLMQESSDSNDLESQVERALITKHASHVITAFEAIMLALGVVKEATGYEVLAKKIIFQEFESKIKIEADNSCTPQAEIKNAQAMKKFNPIFHWYFVAAHARNFWKDDFYDAFEAASISKNVQKIIQTISYKIGTMQSNNISTVTEMVLVPEAISLRTRYSSLKNMTEIKKKCNAEVKNDIVDASTLKIVSTNEVEYKIHRAKFLQSRRRLICCYPPDRETLSALLNANPLVKALLLSQVPIAVVLQILRVDDNFKDISTVMWFEPILGLTGFACGFYALRHPKQLVNIPVRVIEAFSASSVVLSKSLGIAILAHTSLFPEEGKPGGIDISRFLKVVASVPVTLALLFWAYNSISPAFKDGKFSDHTRFILELINQFAIYSGLNQIISIELINMINRIEKVDFSTQLSRILFEFLPAFPAIFFAYARVAPLYSCRKSNAYVNISETINTAVLYLFTAVLLTNLGIDSLLANHLPAAQTNFRRVFFPGLTLASIAVMARFARSFPKLYEGNPEVIIQQVIRRRGLQSMSNGTLTATDDTQPFLEHLTDGEPAEAVPLEHNAMQALRASFATPERQDEGKEILFMHLRSKQKQGHIIQDEGRSVRYCPCALL